MAPTYRSVGVEFLSEYLKFEPRGDLQYCLGFLVKEENAQWVADLSCGICGKEHLTFGNVYMAVSGKLRVVCGSCGLDADLQMPQLHLRDEVQLVLLPCWSFYICCIDSTDLSVLLDRQTDLCWCICHARWWCIFPTQAGHASVPHVMMSADAVKAYSKTDRCDSHCSDRGFAAAAWTCAAADVRPASPATVFHAPLCSFKLGTPVRRVQSRIVALHWSPVRQLAAAGASAAVRAPGRADDLPQLCTMPLPTLDRRFRSHSAEPIAALRTAVLGAAPHGAGTCAAELRPALPTTASHESLCSVLCSLCSVLCRRFRSVLQGSGTGIGRATRCRDACR